MDTIAHASRVFGVWCVPVPLPGDCRDSHLLGVFDNCEGFSFEGHIRHIDHDHKQCEGSGFEEHIDRDSHTTHKERLTNGNVEETNKHILLERPKTIPIGAILAGGLLAKTL